jgi:hypothetical protein
VENGKAELGGNWESYGDRRQEVSQGLRSVSLFSRDVFLAFKVNYWGLRISRLWGHRS